MATITRACIIPIHIDKHYFSYNIKVQLAAVILETIPRLIDFGCIDAGPTTSKKKLLLINRGVKATKFVVDLGSNDLNIIVEPMRGILTSRSQVLFHIELNAMKEGQYQTEFWIISEVPLCIKVFVNVVFGKIEAIHKFAMRQFTFIHFPNTYYGLNSVKTMILKNNSYIGTMFCVTAEKEGEDFHVEDIMKEDSDYSFFNIVPFSGRLPPRDVRAFFFIFSPKLLIKSQSCVIMAMIKINKLYCKDLDLTLYEDELLFDEPEKRLSNSLRLESNASLIQQQNEIPQMENNDDDPEDLVDINKPVTFFENHVRILLHGEVEEVSVSIVPDEIQLSDLVVKQQENRVVQLTNNSQNLPIYCRYRKCAFVDIEPKLIMLKPLEKKDLLVVITARSSGTVKLTVRFDLLYYDYPNLDKELKIIGEVSFSLLIENTVAEMSVYPGRCTIKDACIPRLGNNGEYELTSKGIKVKEELKDYFRKFIRNYAEKMRKTLLVPVSNFEDYEISKAAYRCTKFTIKTIPEIVGSEFIPLTPFQMFNIKIKPRNMIVENVVAKSRFMRSMKIINNNIFPVRAFLKPHKTHNFVFPYGCRKEISAFGEEDVFYECLTENTTIQNHILDVIINENHVYETSISVKLVPKVLHFSFKDAVFQEDEPPYKYLEIYNNVNTDIYFEWDILADLSAEPLKGLVRPGRALTCLIYYDIANCSVNNYELLMKMDNKRSQTFRFILDKLKYEVTFVDEIDFGDVGINVNSQRKAVLNNNSFEPLSFETNIDDFVDGMKVYPRDGIIEPKSKKIFIFQLLRHAAGPFESKMIINVANTTLLSVTIKGNVVLPKVQFNPEIIRFKKMSASSFDVKCLSVKNISNITILFEFEPERIPEMNFTERDSHIFITDEEYYLEPGEEKKFTIHYYPTYALVTSFMAPVLVNKLNYSKLPNFKLYTSVMTHKLFTKTWKYEFFYFPHYESYSKLTQKIRISNPSKSLLKICIRFDQLKEPFSLEHLEGGLCTKYECSIVVELEADTQVIFLAHFRPQTPGFYDIRLPVYVKDDFSEDMHNYFYFKGMYPSAEIKSNYESIYFGMLPLNFQIMTNVELNLHYHNPDCDLKIVSTDINMQIQSGELVMNETVVKHRFQIYYLAHETHNIDTQLQIYCKCGAYKTIKCTGSTENCFITNFACCKYFEEELKQPIDTIFHMSQLNAESKSSLGSYFVLNTTEKIKSYEYLHGLCFPTTPGPFLNYMNSAVKAVEQWLYEQGFYGTVYYKVPDTISIFEITEDKQFMGKTKRFAKIGKSIMLPYFALLKNICGNIISKYFKLELNEQENVVLQVYKVYQQLIDFLHKIQAFVNHITPEFLLSYDDYVDYMSEIGKKPITYTKFYQQSKQFWLDLLLQTYKVFVYKRLLSTNPNLSTYTSTCKIDVCSSLYIFTENIVPINEAIYSDQGAMILNWLNKHFREQKYFLASETFGNDTYDEAILDRKNVQNFSSDLCDGLAFCAVTVALCPYLINHLKGIYVPPMCNEEYLHNACLLIKVWKMMNSSYTIMPKDITQPNDIQMIMFCAYLYEFLIRLKPKETIHLSANLSDSVSESISIGNDNCHAIIYKIVFFDNQDDSFTLENNTITIPPNAVRKLKITYHAKFVKKLKSTMVLCGEMYGNKFTHGKAFYLQGTPLFTNPSIELTASSRVYEIKEISIEFQAPYHEPAVYEIYFTMNEPKEIENLQLVSYKQILNFNSLPRVQIEHGTCEANEEGIISITATVCSVTKNNRDVWVFAKNSTVGDFMVLLHIEAMPSKEFTKICLNLPQNFNELPCNCKIPSVNNSCPRNVILKIPSRNAALWKAVMGQLLRNPDEDEQRFWTTYQKSPIGQHVIKRILMDYKKFVTMDTAYIFNASIEYAVRVKSDDVIAQESLVIANTTKLLDTTDLTLHITGDAKPFKFVLESLDRKELRQYRVWLDFHNKMF
ncbi:PREDICTED: uncharacterized protein LOC108562889 [Nicrophorus vespilloides]|uniref:Uncharacterized protein LOC108562889 n=1 Tax=Nicrophorus vespilloides TaxID=110193 RepID=A0ABM1MQM6_NICVS|nr:PREDICTED: uncharacterized protein LOC108562889 [Nicrophorus vespilloides]